jgi:hypothetical protein
LPPVVPLKAFPRLAFPFARIRSNYGTPSAFFWFGKLSGDVRYQKGNFKLFFPLATMILISVIGTVLIRLFGK